MTVSVVVPARDADATLGRTLEALARQRLDEPYEVVVVDDGSADGTAALAERFGDPVRVVRGSGRGAGRARNAGAAAARGSVLAFTDADCYPAPGWLAAGLAALRGADLVQGAVEPEPGVRMGPFDRSLWVRGESGLYESANLIVRRELFERLGGFEDWIGAGGRPIGEDVWLGWRARRAGARTAFAPDALVHHAVVARGAREYVAERRRLEHFPALVARVPELRESLLFGRLFLSPRSAAFDLALAGAAAALAARSRLPLLAAAPYALAIARRALESGPRAPLAAPVEVAADAVGLAALARGTVRERTAVL